MPLISCWTCRPEPQRSRSWKPWKTISSVMFSLWGLTNDDLIRTYLKNNLNAHGGIMKRFKMLIRYRSLADPAFSPLHAPECRDFATFNLLLTPNLIFEIGFKGNLAYWGAIKNWVLHLDTPSLNCQILVKILTSYRFFLKFKYKIPAEMISI